MPEGDFDAAHDSRVRKAAFDWLALEVALHGDVMPFHVLRQGFDLDGVRVPLLGPQGIFKPAILASAPLTLATSFDSPYDDAFREDGLLRYAYRAQGGPTHRDNESMREALRRQLPLIYLHGVAEAKYLATWPVFVVQDNPEAREFTVAVDDAQHLGLDRSSATGDEREDARRRYTTAIVRVRLHQRAFRERVLDAYRRRCAFCRLKHDELLDAAHLIPDADPAGDPRITNGVALCTLHHAAFDKYFIGIRPDYVIEVRRDLLDEIDGPTLAHAIQGLHHKPIQLPARHEHRPSVACLEQRYERFKKAAI